MNIQTITLKTLSEFIEQEKITRFLLDYNETDRVYIDSTEDMEVLVHRYGVFNDINQMVGFCIVPVYNTDILQRIYISVPYRQMGYAQHAIQQLKINSLGCLNDNYKALNLYRKLGFIEEDNYNQHYRILKLRK